MWDGAAGVPLPASPSTGDSSPPRPSVSNSRHSKNREGLPRAAKRKFAWGPFPSFGNKSSQQFLTRSRSFGNSITSLCDKFTGRSNKGFNSPSPSTPAPSPPHHPPPPPPLALPPFDITEETWCDFSPAQESQDLHHEIQRDVLDNPKQQDTSYHQQDQGENSPLPRSVTFDALGPNKSACADEIHPGALVSALTDEEITEHHSKHTHSPESPPLDMSPRKAKATGPETPKRSHHNQGSDQMPSNVSATHLLKFFGPEVTPILEKRPDTSFSRDQSTVSQTSLLESPTPQHTFGRKGPAGTVTPIDLSQRMSERFPPPETPTKVHRPKHKRESRATVMFPPNHVSGPKPGVDGTSNRFNPAEPSGRISVSRGEDSAHGELGAALIRPDASDNACKQENPAQSRLVSEESLLSVKTEASSQISSDATSATRSRWRSRLPVTINPASNRPPVTLETMPEAQTPKGTMKPPGEKKPGFVERLFKRSTPAPARARIKITHPTDINSPIHHQGFQHQGFSEQMHLIPLPGAVNQQGRGSTGQAEQLPQPTDSQASHTIASENTAPVTQPFKARETGQLSESEGVRNTKDLEKRAPRTSEFIKHESTNPPAVGTSIQTHQQAGPIRVDQEFPCALHSHIPGKQTDCQPSGASHIGLQLPGAKHLANIKSLDDDLGRSQQLGTMQSVPMVTVRSATPPPQEEVNEGKPENTPNAFLSTPDNTESQSAVISPGLQKYTPKREKTTTIRVDLEDRGKTAPRNWKLLDHEGLFKNIFHYLDRGDMAIFSRVCRFAKCVVEPCLYHTIELSPRPPSSVCYHSLSDSLLLLSRGGVEQKLLEYTRQIKIGAGWMMNHWAMYDLSDTKNPHRRVSPVEAISKGYFEWPEEMLDGLLARQIEGKVRDGEGFGDGGAADVLVGMTLLLQKAKNVEKLVWGSHIPIKNRSKGLFFKKPLKHVEFNLARPEKMWVRNPESGLDLVGVPNYHPNLSSLSRCPLVTLALTNVATVDATWWTNLFKLIKDVSRTLRHLCLEVTGPNLPLLSWHSSFQAGTKNTLQLESLRVRGMTVDQQSIAILSPEILRSVSLLGCSPNAGLVFADSQLKSITNFATDTWEFVDLALSIARSGGRKVVFTPSVPGSAGKVGELMKAAVALEKLHLSAYCKVSTPILSEFFSVQPCVANLELALVRDQWNILLEHLHCLTSLRRLILHIDNEGKELKKGRRRRFPADDAEEAVDAVKKGRKLVEVGAGGFRWKVNWKVEPPNIYRVVG
ncbi:hypothetical protein FN846DRAFT_48328 [Sphaerosporella brunnea]|uniref:F-box domain-containing protein n=1 Tax=Sphaerosporella brunnea TaxID=1250544 RepID=A0A5J5EUC3_9PEZI|nr:hypothetical protein FN846DRAFT_48328 [Sphaerosporella brunnea]